MFNRAAVVNIVSKIVCEPCLPGRRGLNETNPSIN